MNDMAGDPDGGSGSQSLYARRKKIFPRKVSGFYRSFKWVVMAITLAIYYITPWLRWDRGPFAPDQAVLVDLAHRRFYFFAIEIWPQEFYYVAGLLVMAGVGLFLVTAIFGRAWCGYACPQTVWVDLFLAVERFIDGDRNAQMRLQNAPWGPVKLAKRAAKHGIWLLIGVATGGAWVFYFADAPTLAMQLFSGDAPFVAYSAVGILTLTTYVFGGLMREQVCIYMCPWPRIQSAMLDEQSLIVTYKDWRGEPRSHGVKKAVEAGTPVGDCIDCNACVAVCPMGIDIRDGAQLACITCALCIDACDEVMAKIDRPRGLIDYATLEDCRDEAAGKPPVPILRTVFRPRAILYFGLWCAAGLAMAFALGQRERLQISVSHDRNPLYVRLADGSIRNAYSVKLSNMESRPREIQLTLEGLPEGVMWDSLASDKTATTTLAIPVGADRVETRRIYVRAAPAQESKSEFRFLARDSKGEATAEDNALFERPDE